MGIVLSERVAGQLKELLNENTNGSPGTLSGGGTRQVIHVLITEELEDCFFACVPTAFVAVDNQWRDYTEAECVALEPNNNKLKVGDTYLAVRYGIDTFGRYVFVTEHYDELGPCASDSDSDSDDSDSDSTDDDDDSDSGCTDNSFEFLADVNVECVDGNISVSKTFKTATWNGRCWEVA